MKIGVVIGAVLLLFIACAELKPACPQTIALVDRNPGNISPLHLRYWPGAIGFDPWGHAIFRTRRGGLEALRGNLLAYWRIHHLDTVRKIVRRWTPSKDDPWQRQDYMLGVAEEVGVRPDDLLNMESPYTLEALGKAIALEESGCDSAYPDSLWDSVFLGDHHEKAAVHP